MGKHVFHTPFDVYDYRGRSDARWVDPSRTRTCQDYPYSYDEFFLWGDREAAKSAKDGVYSDRLRQWDYDKNQRCFREVGEGQSIGWRSMSSKQASRWLSIYYGRPLKAVALAEGCNPSNGYPYWIVWFSPAPPTATADEGRPA